MPAARSRRVSRYGHGQAAQAPLNTLAAHPS
jgi:hypothetical protein